VVYRFGTSVYYANAAKLAEDIAALAGHGGPLRWLVLDCAAIEDVDYSASAMLARVIEHVHQHHVHLVLSSVLGLCVPRISSMALSSRVALPAVRP
jgi:sulfate permease, SulP family